MPKDLRIKAKLSSADDYKAFDVLCAEMGYTNRSEFAGRIILDRIQGRSTNTKQPTELPLREMSPPMAKRRDLRNQLTRLIGTNLETYQAFLHLSHEHLLSTDNPSSLSSQFQEFIERGFDSALQKGVVEFTSVVDDALHQVRLTPEDRVVIAEIFEVQQELSEMERKVLNE